MKKRVLHGFILSVSWLVLPIYGKITSTKQFFGLCIGFLLTWMIGYLLSYYHNKPFWSSKKEGIWISILVLVDQVLKLLVKHFLSGEGELVIFPQAISIHRLDNIHHSAITSFFRLDVSGIVMGIFKIVALLILWYVLNQTIKETGKTGYTSLGKVLLFSGGIASAMDTFFWGFTLDFIQLKGFFTMDTKDLYISLAVGVFLIYFFQNRKKER